jgi:hypothetical protein
MNKIKRKTGRASVRTGYGGTKKWQKNVNPEVAGKADPANQRVFNARNVAELCLLIKQRSKQNEFLRLNHNLLESCDVMGLTSHQR